MSCISVYLPSGKDSQSFQVSFLASITLLKIVIPQGAGSSKEVCQFRGIRLESDGSLSTVCSVSYDRKTLN